MENNMATRTQLDKIVTFLQNGGRLTKTVALKKFGVRRLSARILDLRNEGFVIYTNKRSVSGSIVTHYRLDNSQQA